MQRYLVIYIFIYIPASFVGPKVLPWDKIKLNNNPQLRILPEGLDFLPRIHSQVLTKLKSEIIQHDAPISSSDSAVSTLGFCDQAIPLRRDPVRNGVATITAKCLCARADTNTEFPIWHDSKGRRESASNQLITLGLFHHCGGKYLSSLKQARLLDVDMPPLSMILLPAPPSIDLRNALVMFVTLVIHMILFLIKEFI